MRAWISTAVILLLLVSAGAAPAWASEGAEKAQLDLGEQLNWPSVITSIVVFLVLLWVLSKVAWKPILEGLHQREETIKKALDDAAAANEQAKALILEYEAKLETAREEGKAILEETRRDAQDLRAQIEADASQKADETVDRAKREIEQITAKAWDGLVRDAASVATQAASQIIQKALSPEGHAEIVSGVVADLAARRARRTGKNVPGPGHEGAAPEGPTPEGTA